jgi:hypothetical protein
VSLWSTNSPRIVSTVTKAVAALRPHGNHDRFLVHVHSDIFNFTTHLSCLLGGKQFVPTSTFPQGKSAIVQDTHLAFS